MRLFFVVALLATLAGGYLYCEGNAQGLARLRAQCQEVESEIQQCRTAEKASHVWKHRKTRLSAENERLRVQLKQKH